MLFRSAAISFAAGQSMLSRDRLFAFYMLPTRAGGLLLGAIAAIAVHAGLVGSVDRGGGSEADAATDAHPSAGPESPVTSVGAHPGSIVAEVAAGLGALLVLGSFAFLSENSPYPGWRAALPALGASLVLLAGAGRPNTVSRLLSSKPLVAIGLASYSAYLWQIGRAHV